MSSSNSKNKNGNDNIVMQKHWPKWAKKSYKNQQQTNAMQDALNELSMCDNSNDYDDDKENSFI